MRKGINRLIIATAGPLIRSPVAARSSMTTGEGRCLYLWDSSVPAAHHRRHINLGSRLTDKGPCPISIWIMRMMDSSHSTDHGCEDSDTHLCGITHLFEYRLDYLTITVKGHKLNMDKKQTSPSCHRPNQQLKNHPRG